jgi:hypothetical protein
MSECSVDFATFTVTCDGAIYRMEPEFEVQGSDEVAMDTYRVVVDGDVVGVISYGDPVHDVRANGTRVTTARLHIIADAWFSAVGSALDDADVALS